MTTNSSHFSKIFCYLNSLILEQKMLFILISTSVKKGFNLKSFALALNIYKTDYILIKKYIYLTNICGI